MPDSRPWTGADVAQAELVGPFPQEPAPGSPEAVERAARTLEAYRLPDGRLVAIDADVSRGADAVSFEVAGGRVVEAVKFDPPIALAEKIETLLARWDDDSEPVDSLSALAENLDWDLAGFLAAGLAPDLLAENERLRLEAAVCALCADHHHAKPGECLQCQKEDLLALTQQLRMDLERIKAVANRALHGDKSAYFASLEAIRDLAHSAAGRLS